MPTARECKCCHYYSRVVDKIQDGHTCITEHPGFASNCLDIYVLEHSVYEFLQEEGPIGDDELVNE